MRAVAAGNQTTVWMIAAALCVTAGARQARSQEAAAARGVGAEAPAEADSPRLPRAPYVGGEACSDCHRGAYASWLGTKHARSHVLLDTAEGRAIAAGMGVVGNLGATGSKCLDCHVTAADVGSEHRLPGFRAEEGVQCEACHGPGGGHVAADLKVGRSFVLASRMEIPTRERCLRCHETEPSHVAALGTPPFDYDRLLERIRHPEGIGERLAVLRRQPGAVMVRLLRRLLHSAYSL